MLAPYQKRYIRLYKVEELEKTLVYAVLLEHNGQKEIVLSEPYVVRIILKQFTNQPTLLLANQTNHKQFQEPIESIFVQPSFISVAFPSFSYARPPTQNTLLFNTF